MLAEAGTPLGPLSPPGPVLLHGDTHCPPAGGWTAGPGVGGHGPGCHSGSGSRSGHSVEPADNQRAEVMATPEMDSMVLPPGPDSLVFRFLAPGVSFELLNSPRRQADL